MKASISTVAIRADAAASDGTGHVMRCLSLAEELIDHGIRVVFLGQSFEAINPAEIHGRGAELLTLAGTNATQKQDTFEQDDFLNSHDSLVRASITAEWFIVDHYRLGCAWHQAARQHGYKVLAVDDLADRPLCPDMLVNQNPTWDLHKRYNQHSPNTTLLLGPTYSLIRSDVRRQYRRRQKMIATAGKWIPVFLGGTDQDRLTLKVLEALSETMWRDQLIIIYGQSNSSSEEIRIFSETHGISVQAAQSLDQGLLCESKFAVVACGMFAVELQALGIPCILFPLSPIQMLVAEYFQEQGNAIICNFKGHDFNGTLCSAIQSILPKSREIQASSQLPFMGARNIVRKMESYE